MKDEIKNNNRIISGLLDEKIKEMAKNYGRENDEEFLKNENVRNYIKQGLESEKAIEFLVENAKIK